MVREQQIIRSNKNNIKQTKKKSYLAERETIQENKKINAVSRKWGQVVLNKETEITGKNNCKLRLYNKYGKLKKYQS